MKVAVISHAYQDERYLTALDGMAKMPDVTISLIHPETYKGKRFHWSEAHSISHVPVPVIFGGRQGAFLYRPRALGRAIDRVRPDVLLHEQEVYALGAAQIAAIAEQRSIPLVQFVWENVDRSLAPPRCLLRRYALARITAKIAGSFGAKRLHQNWGFTRQIEVLPQMSVQFALSPRFLRRDKDAFRVCFVGRLVADKGVDCLLRAVAGMHRNGFPIECAIAGEGPELRRLTVLARELGIWALVQFCGRLHGDGVRTLLRSSEVLVLPSRRTKHWEEQFGLVLAEAMAEATVTVGSRTGAIPEIIGMSDLLFDEDDVQGLTGILARLATDDGFFLWHQVHLWQQARERFSTDRVAAQKIQYLQSVLEKARTGRSEFATGLQAGSSENPSFAQSI